MSESVNLKRNIENFKTASIKIGDKINRAGDIWKDSNYVSLHRKIDELAKDSRSVIENGEKTCMSIDKFFTIANEKI